jgi:nitrite reductase/ring-hydroxylating ferredoxin subunit
MTSWHLAAHLDEIPEGRCLQLPLAGNSLLLCKIKGEVYCVEDRCSHRAIPLNQGWLEGYELVCPLHGASFDVRTGAACKLPAKAAIAHFPIRIDDQQRIFIFL